MSPVRCGLWRRRSSRRTGVRGGILGACSVVHSRWGILKGTMRAAVLRVSLAGSIACACRLRRVLTLALCAWLHPCLHTACVTATQVRCGRRPSAHSRHPVLQGRRCRAECGPHLRRDPWAIRRMARAQWTCCAIRLRRSCYRALRCHTALRSLCDDVRALSRGALQTRARSTSHCLRL